MAQSAANDHPQATTIGVRSGTCTAIGDRSHMHMYITLAIIDRSVSTKQKKKEKKEK